MQILGPNAGDTPESDIALFQQFITDPSTSIPIDSNFLIVFKSFPKGLKNFTDSEISNYEPNKWQISNNKDSLISLIEGPTYNYTCLFANGTTLPSETVGSKRVGVADDFGDISGGILSGVVSTSRTQRSPLRITFLETTDSFIDSVLRPWIVAVSHYGLFARSDDSIYSVKTDIMVFMFNSRGSKRLLERKMYAFYGCAPIAFDEQSVTYGTNSTKEVATQWVYNYYTIRTTSAAGNAATGGSQTLGLSNISPAAVANTSKAVAGIQQSVTSLNSKLPTSITSKLPTAGPNIGSITSLIKNKPPGL